MISLQAAWVCWLLSTVCLFASFWFGMSGSWIRERAKRRGVDTNASARPVEEVYDVLVVPSRPKSRPRCAGGGTVIEAPHDLRIGSVEKRYSAIRRAQQADARRRWLSSADEFRRVTRSLIATCDSDQARELFTRPLSMLPDARKAIEQITAQCPVGGVGESR